MAAQEPQPGPPKAIKRRIVDPVAEFLNAETAGGFALLIGAVTALVWVNGWGPSGYEAIWTTKLDLGIGGLGIDLDLRHWVNDGLMVFFFFLISLEIKRELVVGDLREPKAAALPIVAAMGGVLVPIALYLVIADMDAREGWGIPMATDAAFALGVIAILGKRVGIGVKLFLVTIAVVDDVMAICVIAIAYTEGLSAIWLLAALAGVVGVVMMRRVGVSAIAAYIPIGIAIWIATYESGVHATLAGVALGLLTPAKPVRGRKVLEVLEERVHPFSSYFVLPLFALANAGVELGGSTLSDGAARNVALAVAVALVAGKFLGIAGATLLALRLRLGTLPEGVDLRGALGAAALGGIGFTVSLFITPLAFSDQTLVEGAKLGILAGSVVSAVAGVVLLAPGGRHPTRRRRASN